MWMMILMSCKWYAKEFDGESHLRECMDELFEHVNQGTVVSICDDLDTWCDEMRINREAVVVVVEE